MCTKRKNFENLIQHCWQQKFTDSNLYCLQKKSKLLKDKVKTWNATRFGNIFRQLEKIQTKLTHIQKDLLSNPTTPHLIEAHNRWLLVRNRLLQYNHNYWSQKAKNII